MHGIMVPLAHCLRGYTTMHIELCPVQDALQDGAQYGGSRKG
jgi:hypothetical protein